MFDGYCYKLFLVSAKVKIRLMNIQRIAKELRH